MDSESSQNSLQVRAVVSHQKAYIPSAHILRAPPFPNFWLNIFHCL